MIEFRKTSNSYAILAASLAASCAAAASDAHAAAYQISVCEDTFGPAASVPYHFDGLPDAASAGGVPEPSTWAKLLIGFAGLGGAMLRRARRGAAPGTMTNVLSRGLRARNASAFAACAAAFLAAGAAQAQITYGWKYQDTAGSGDSSLGAPSRGLWLGDGPPALGCNGCVLPAVTETLVTTAKGGSALAGAGASEPATGLAKEGTAETWIDYTFMVPAATNARTTLVMNTDENVSSLYDGVAAVLVGIKPFAATPSDFQDLFFTNPSSDDWEQGLVVQKGLITDFEWPFYNPFGVDEPRAGFTTTAGTTASKTETIDFAILTNRTYTIRTVAYAASEPSSGALERTGPYSGGDYRGGSLAIASFDPTFSLLGGPADAKIVGLPADALTGYVPPAGAVPEPSTWAMMLVGFVGLGYAKYCRSLSSRHQINRSKS
jgi:PEP-CTERM motif